MTHPFPLLSQPLAEEPSPKTITHSVSEFIFPSLEVCTEDVLYFRQNERVNYDYNDRQFFLTKGGRLLFDTYFNSFSVAKFRRYTALQSLQLQIAGEGTFKIRFRLNRIGYSTRLLSEIVVNLDHAQTERIGLPFYEKLEAGILFPIVECLSSKGRLTHLSFVTNDPPLRPVRLGIVITHFKREQQVTAAIQRLHSLLEAPAYREKIDLIVVDNSNTLVQEQCGLAHLIANKNYGGSGGFTRGLLHMIQQGDHTHCLFMDDDASCEIESIRRTYTLLQFTKDEKMSVAGAQLLENIQYMQFENGASYQDGIVRPLKTHMDLRGAKEVLYNEEEEKVDYGAWWFFAFPIRPIEYLSFPFFVRGDDITFSVQNKLPVMTLNGICTWGENFTHKISAMERYLTMRSTLQMAVLNNPSEKSKREVLAFFKRQVLYDLKTYNYDRAELMCEAMHDVLKGEFFWTAHLNMDEKRKYLQSLITNEKVHKIPDVYRVPEGTSYSPDKEGMIRKIIRVITLNGHLLPEFLLHKALYRLDRYEENTPSNTFRKTKILYYDPYSLSGYYAERSPARFFKVLRKFIKGYRAFGSEFSRLVIEFKSSDLMTVEFWKDVYRV